MTFAHDFAALSEEKKVELLLLMHKAGRPRGFSKYWYRQPTKDEAVALLCRGGKVDYWCGVKFGMNLAHPDPSSYNRDCPGTTAEQLLKRMTCATDNDDNEDTVHALFQRHGNGDLMAVFLQKSYEAYVRKFGLTWTEFTRLHDLGQAPNQPVSQGAKYEWLNKLYSA